MVVVLVLSEPPRVSYPVMALLAAVHVRNGPARHPIDPTLAASGSGRGLDGLQQRVQLVGGRITTGPTDGGFAVDAVLPAYVPTSRRP